MFNIKSYFIFLNRNRLYTFVNVLGLSVSLAFVILIANYTFPQFKFDHFHENADNIYTIGEGSEFGTSYIYAAQLKDRYPDIEQTCALTYENKVGTIKVSDVEYEDVSAYSVDTSFFDMFSFELKYGNRENVLADLNNVVLSESFAEKMFGELNPVGEMVALRDSVIFTVSGVFKDFENTQFHEADMIVRIEHAPRFNPWSLRKGNASGVILFMQGIQGADLRLKRDAILDYFKEDSYIYKNGTWDNVTITPLKEMYFSGGAYDYGTLAEGDKMRVVMLSVIGLIILAFAIFNYINLTVAQTGFRAKEMATRRLLGASKGSIFSRMIIEATLLCAVAFLLAWSFAEGLEPHFNNLIYTDVSIVDDISLGWVSSYVGLIIVLGVISGVVPAVVISRYRPIDVVKGTFAFKSKMVFSKIFITIQSVLTIVLIACSITTVKQVQYILNADLGYNQQNIIDVNVWGLENRNDILIFRERLNSLPFVRRVGFTTHAPLDMVYNNGLFSVDGIEKMVGYRKCVMDTSAVAMLGLEVLIDNKLADDGLWLTESGIKKLGLKPESLFFKTKENNHENKIRGVLKDFVQGSITTEANKPVLLLRIHPDLGERMSMVNHVLIEVDAGFSDSYQEIKKLFQEVTDISLFHANFIEDEIGERHQEEKSISTVVIIFAIVAIIISALGLLAMSAYFVQQKSKEIAVRKVFGSTSSEILKQLTWQFLRLVVLAFFIACPIVWYVMTEWLSNFAYRTDLAAWIFIVAGLFTLLVSFATVYWQSSIAANANPVDSIKR